MAATVQAQEPTNLPAVLAQVQELSREITDLRRELADTRKPAPVRYATPAAAPAAKAGQQTGHRFDATQKWLDESGWADQSPEHDAAYPVLRHLLEKERWPGAHIRITHDQIAKVVRKSRDTVRRRVRTLKKLRAIEVRHTPGDRYLTIIIQHPIATPVSYQDVRWAAGGLGEGTPPGHIANLTGARRAYAELYGVEIPEASPEPVPAVPDQDGAPPVEETEEPPEDQRSYGLDVAPDDPPCQETPRNTKPEVQGVQNGRGGGAGCPPLETSDNTVLRESVTSDAPAREKHEDDGPNNHKPPRLEEIDSRVEEIPPQEITEDAVADAQLLVEACGRYDARSRADMARIAEYLARRGERELVGIVAARIRRSRRRAGRGGVEIASPRRYVLAAILDAREKALTPEERELAARVAAAPVTSREGVGGEPGRRSSKDLKRGYEWLFESPGGAGGGSGGNDYDPAAERSRRDEDLARVRELLGRREEEGGDLRRLLARVREGRRFAGGRSGTEVLAAAVAETLSGDELDAGRWLAAVEELVCGRQRDTETERRP